MMGTKNFNPFNEVASGDRFVGREKARKFFEQRLNGLSAGSPSHAIVAGANGTGKTSYLRRIIELAREQGYATAFFEPGPNADQAATMSIAPIIGEIVRGVDARLNQQKLGDDWDLGVGSKLFDTPKVADPPSQVVVRDLKYLQERMLPEVPGVLVCIDEGRRISGTALSTLKLVLSDPEVTRFLVFVSHFASREQTAVVEARAELKERAQHASGDQGADAFLKGGIALGPFESDEIAADCIRKRLVDNVLEFDDDVVRHIGRIEELHPRQMIDLASDVYEATSELGAAKATFTHLVAGFERRHPNEKEDSQRAFDGLPGTARDAVAALLRLRRESTADEVVEAMYGDDAANAAKARLASVVRNDLELACATRIVRRVGEERYATSDERRAFAFDLAMRE